MEIRQIKKEIDIRPASYLDENAGYVENRESKKIPLKFRSSLVQINSHVSWVNSGLADKKSNGNTANKERNRYTTGVIFRRECRKCREILFKFKVQPRSAVHPHPTIRHDVFYLLICFELHSEEI